MPPDRRGSVFRGFTGTPATGAVLDGRRAPRPLLLRLLPYFGQRGDSHFLARTLDARPLIARAPSLACGLFVVVLLLALGFAAQASRGVQVSGGGGSGTHGSNLQNQFR